MQSLTKLVDDKLNVPFDQLITKQLFIKGLLNLLLILYASKVVPQLPVKVLEVCNNTYFRLVVFTLIAWTATHSPSTAMLVAVAFWMTLNYTSTGKMFESLDNVVSTQLVTEVPVGVPVGVSKEVSVSAVDTLGDAAKSPKGSSPEIVIPVAEAALVNTSTQSGVESVQKLASGAMADTPVSSSAVNAEVNNAKNSIDPSTVVTKEDSTKAVVALAQAASSDVPVPPEVVIPVAKVAIANATTESGKEAIKALAEQAATPIAGTPENVKKASDVALDSINDAKPLDVKEAVTLLANAAASSEASKPELVIPVANVAVSGMKTDAGVASVKALAEQAVTPYPGTVENVANAALTAIKSSNQDVALKQSSGCYPVRNYDMSLVKPMQDGLVSFEDYQEYVPLSK